MRHSKFINFFLELKQEWVPVSLREYLASIEAMDAEMQEDVTAPASPIRRSGKRENTSLSACALLLIS